MSIAMRIAVLQPLVVPGDVDENLRRAAVLLESAARGGARLALFSECGLTGYDHACVGLRSAISREHAAIDALQRLAAGFQMDIVNGFYERDGSDLFNTAVLVRADGSRLFQRKHRIIQWEAGNTPVRAAARERTIFDVDGISAAILICADAGIEGIHQELADRGVKLLLMATAGCGALSFGYSEAEVRPTGPRRDQWLARQQQVAYPQGSVEVALRYDMVVAACNQAGYEPELDYFHCGHSSVVDRDGRLAALICGQFVFEHLRPVLSIAELEDSWKSTSPKR